MPVKQTPVRRNKLAGTDAIVAELNAWQGSSWEPTAMPSSEPRMTDTAAVVRFRRGAGPGRWFRKDPIFDTLMRTRFLAAHEAAVRGGLDPRQGTTEGAPARGWSPKRSLKGSVAFRAAMPCLAAPRHRRNRFSWTAAASRADTPADRSQCHGRPRMPLELTRGRCSAQDEATHAAASAPTFMNRACFQITGMVHFLGS